jgi:DNA replication protein DnaC
MSKTTAKTKDVPRLDIDTIGEQLQQLGLLHAAEILTSELSEGVKNNRSAHQVLGRLICSEVARRDEHRVHRALKTSNLPPGMTLEEFDFSFQPSINKGQVETLATGTFIREHYSILLQGPPGTGKTHLAVALGIKAIEHGFRVGFFRLEDLLHELKKDADLPLSRLRRKKYCSAAYLVIDEVGFEPMSADEASLLFRLISYRYMRGSTVITTNKSVKEWPGLFAGDEAMTAALLDRLLHRSVVINIRGRSYRLMELEKSP